MPSRKELALALPLLCLLVLLPFWQLATGQGVVITNDVGVSDIANLQYPLRFFAGQELRQGRLPLWTPGVYMGYPLLAEGQAGVFSPVNLLLFGLLSVPTALNVGSLLPFVIAAIGAYLLARELAAGVSGALLAGFSYAMSGFYVAHVKHIPIVTTACWIPVVLLLVERGVRRSDTALLGAGLVLGVQWLSGSPQMAYYSAGIAMLYFAGRAWQLRRERPLQWTIPLFALAVVLSLGLAAVQLLPTYELTGLSERAGGASYEFATRFPYAMANLETFLYPLANGTPGTRDLTVSSIFWEDYAYVGLIPLFLGLIGGLVLARRSGVARLLVGLTALTFLTVLGPNTPFFRIAHRTVPGLSFFRFPQRLLAFVTLFLVLLGALALTRLQGWIETSADRGRRGKSKKTFLAEKVKRQKLARAATGIALALMALDLYAYHIPWNAIVDADVWLEPPETAQVVQQRVGSELYRVFSYDVYSTFRDAYRRADGWRGDLEPYVAQREFLQPSLNLIYDVPTADGYVNLVPECLTALWGTEKQLGLMDTELVDEGEQMLAKPGFIQLLGLYNVRFLITSKPVQDEALELVGVYGPGAHLYENRQTLPRAFLVSNYALASDTEGATLRDTQAVREALELMSAPSFDGTSTVVLAEPPDTPVSSTQELSATVEVLSYQGTRVVMAVESNGPGWLVFSDTYYPGWEATVDGHPTPINLANGCVRAVPIETEGWHEVVFRFRPRPFYRGALISGVSMALWAIAWAALKIKAGRRST